MNPWNQWLYRPPGLHARIIINLISWPDLPLSAVLRLSDVPVNTVFRTFVDPIWSACFMSAFRGYIPERLVLIFWSFLILFICRCVLFQSSYTSWAFDPCLSLIFHFLYLLVLLMRGAVWTSFLMYLLEVTLTMTTGPVSKLRTCRLITGVFIFVN